MKSHGQPASQLQFFSHCPKTHHCTSTMFSPFDWTWYDSRMAQLYLSLHLLSTDAPGLTHSRDQTHRFVCRAWGTGPKPKAKADHPWRDAVYAAVQIEFRWRQRPQRTGGSTREREMAQLDLTSNLGARKEMKAPIRNRKALAVVLGFTPVTDRSGAIPLPGAPINAPNTATTVYYAEGHRQAIFEGIWEPSARRHIPCGSGYRDIAPRK